MKELKRKRKDPLILRIKRKVPYVIWDFLFYDRYSGGSKWNAMADPPTYVGSSVKWKNLGLIFLIIWVLIITYMVFT